MTHFQPTATIEPLLASEVRRIKISSVAVFTLTFFIVAATLPVYFFPGVKSAGEWVFVLVIFFGALILTYCLFRHALGLRKDLKSRTKLVIRGCIERVDREVGPHGLHWKIWVNGFPAYDPLCGVGPLDSLDRMKVGVRVEISHLVLARRTLRIVIL